MEVLRQEDPRDNFAKMCNDELRMLAKNHGLKVHPQAKSPMIIDLLKSAGVKAPDMSHRVLGQPMMWGQPEPRNEMPLPPSITAEELMRREFEEMQKEEPKVLMSRPEMAKECKKRGIKFKRTDTKEKLAELLS